MALTRRDFLKRSATMAAGASLAPSMRWMPGTNVAYAAGPADAIVVFVQLYGGNDGVNTVYPTSAGTQRTKYEEYRPTLQLPDNAGGLTPWNNEGFDTSNGILDLGTDGAGDAYALHPAMKHLHDVHQAGELATVPGVHYPFADYSHFRSEVIYYTGDPITAAGGGWFGKYLDLSGYGSLDVPAVMMGGDYNPLFTPTETSLFAFRGLNELTFPAGNRRTERSAAFKAMYGESGASDPAFFPELALVGGTGEAAVEKFQEYYESSSTESGKVEKLFTETGSYNRENPLVYTSPLNPDQGMVTSGNRLARDLRHVAATIRSDVGARFFHVATGGFDSHSNQEQGYYHSYLLKGVSDAVAAFWADMKSPATLPAGYETDGYLDGDLSPRVLIVTLSEFGRTNKQNTASASTAGTDHGRSAPQFVIGSTVQGGIHGSYPTLDDPQLDDDLRNSFDFRDFYGTIFERWLNVPAVEIGPGPGKFFAATPVPDWLGQDYTAYTPIPFLLP